MINNTNTTLHKRLSDT